MIYVVLWDRNGRWNAVKCFRKIVKEGLTALHERGALELKVVDYSSH